MNFRRLFVLICIILFHAGCFVKINAAIYEYFKEIHLTIDTGKYIYPNDTVVFLDEPHFF